MKEILTDLGALADYCSSIDQSLNQYRLQDAIRRGDMETINAIWKYAKEVFSCINDERSTAVEYATTIGRDDLTESINRLFNSSSGDVVGR